MHVKLKAKVDFVWTSKEQNVEVDLPVYGLTHSWYVLFVKLKSCLFIIKTKTKKKPHIFTVRNI